MNIRLARWAWAIVAVGAPLAVASSQTPTRLRAILPAYREPIALDTVMLVTKQAAPAGKVWATAEKVFYDLKIPVDTRDSVRGIIGVIKFTKSGYLLDKPISALLNCGTSITGPNADNFRISMVLVAMVMADTGGTTGRLEADFADRVKKRLAAAP